MALFKHAALFLLLAEKAKGQAPDLSCDAGFVDCVKGFVRGTTTTCQDACNGNCCVDPATNSNACLNAHAKICKDGSCMGDKACQDIMYTVGSAVIPEPTTIITGVSCLGKSACQGIGFNQGEVLSVSGGSCNGNDVCFALGNGGKVGHVFNGSCLGGMACNRAATESGEIQSISNSCKGYRVCYMLAAKEGSVDAVTDSCNIDTTGDSSCELALKGCSLEYLQGSCNAHRACNQAFSDDSKSCTKVTISSLNSCCNESQSCENLMWSDSTAPATAPAECSVAPPTTSPTPRANLNIASASALAFNDDCDVNFVGATEVNLSCTFASTSGVTSKAEIVPGSCANNDNFNRPAEGDASTDAVVTAKYNFASSITDKEKNDGTEFVKEFCLRSDVFGLDGSTLVSVGAKKFDIDVTLTYTKSANFIVNGIQSAAFEATQASATDTRTVTLDAAQGTCAAPAPATVSTGDKLTICVSSTDTDIKVTGVNTVTAKSVNAANSVVGTQTIVDAGGQSNFVTSVAESGNKIELSTLVVPYYADQLNGAAGSLKIEGTGTIDYVTTRRLSDGRMVQEVETVEDAPFSMEFPLGENDMPEIAQADENSGSSVAGGLAASAAASVFAIYGIA